MSVAWWGGLVGKSASVNLGYAQGESQEEPMEWSEASKKEPLAADGVRTKTDTGGREEYSKAREWTLVKELGKLSP